MVIKIVVKVAELTSKITKTAIPSPHQSVIAAEQRRYSFAPKLLSNCLRHWLRSSSIDSPLDILVSVVNVPISLERCSAFGTAPLKGVFDIPGQPISRILYTLRCGDHLSWLPVTRQLMQPTRDLRTGRPRRRRKRTYARLVPAWPCSWWGLPGRNITATPAGSYLAFSPLPDPFPAIGGLFLWPDPAPYGAPDVIRHRALWSADFPRPSLGKPSESRGHPANLVFQSYHNRLASIFPKILGPTTADPEALEIPSFILDKSGI
jgi:hypothetical protein